jgi:hypothetical protein
MRYVTWGEFRDKIEREQDLQEDPDILAQDELMGMVNDAIDLCEAQFIKLRDYFLADTVINIVAGQANYDLPSDIWGYKIRNFFLPNCHEIKELKDIKKIPMLNFESSSDPYYFKIINNASGPKIRLFPTPSRDIAAPMFYTREANRLTPAGGDAQIIDIPEGMNYIREYINLRIEKKEKSPMYSLSKDELLYFEQLLMDSLALTTDDENNEIEPNVELYEDHV